MLTLKEIVQASLDLVTVVEKGPREYTGVDGEEIHIYREIASTQERRRVRLILDRIEDTSVIDRAANVVVSCKVIEHAWRVDRQVASVVCIRIPHTQDDERCYHSPNEKVQPIEVWKHERRMASIINKGIPVEGWERVVTHAVIHAGNRSQIDVAWCNPREPAKEAQGLEYIPWKPEVYKHAEEGKCEKL